MNPYLFAHRIKDETLMKRYQAGEFFAFEALYIRHYAKVYTYIQSRMHDARDAQKIFNKIWEKLHKTRNSYNYQYPFIKWLYTISRTELNHFCQKNHVIPIKLDVSSLKTKKKVTKLDDLTEVKKLSRYDLKALKLKFYHDHDYKEISRILLYSNPKTHRFLSKIIRKMAKYIKRK